MTCLDCMALGGLHDCATCSLFLGLLTVNFMMNPESALRCASCNGSEFFLIFFFELSFWRHERLNRMSNSQ